MSDEEKIHLLHSLLTQYAHQLGGKLVIVIPKPEADIRGHIIVDNDEYQFKMVIETELNQPTTH